MRQPAHPRYRVVERDRHARAEADRHQQNGEEREGHLAADRACTKAFHLGEKCEKEEAAALMHRQYPLATMERRGELAGAVDG